MKVRMTFMAPKIVEPVNSEGVPTGAQAPMPEMVFHYTNAAGENVVARNGEVHDVPEDVYKRCLKPYKLAVPVEDSVVPNAGEESGAPAKPMTAAEKKAAEKAAAEAAKAAGTDTPPQT